MKALDNTETLRMLRSELDGGYVGENYTVTCLSKVTESQSTGGLQGDCESW